MESRHFSEITKVNMQNNKLRLSAALLAVIVTTVLLAGGTYAYQGGFAGKSGDHLGKIGAIKEAIVNNDYSALGEDAKISEEDFERMVEIHELMEAGDYEAVKELKKEFGGSKVGYFGKKFGKNKKNFDPEKREAVMNALNNNDYNALLEAVGADSKIAQIINEDNFSRFVEAHNHMQDARAIFKELGVERGHGIK